eukprot:15051871-Heterocapsa_arctica.AAC.1
MGRWGSDTVLQYVSDVPLSAFTRRVIDKFSTIDLEGVTQRVIGETEVGLMKAALERAAAEVGLASKSLRLLVAQVDLAKRRADTEAHGYKHVLNNSSGVV